MAIQLGPRSRMALRYAGIALLGVFTFILTVQLTLPVDRMREKVIEALSPSYDVKIGSVERGLVPGRVYFKSIWLSTRKTKPEDPVTTFTIEKLQVDVGLLSLLGGNLTIDLDATIGSGDLKATVVQQKWGKKGTVVHVTGHDLPGSALPMTAVLGLPMTGKLELSADLTMPREVRAGALAINWAKAEGNFEFGCPNGCTFGDGKTKLRPILKNRTNQVMVADGIDFGTVEIDSMLAKAEFKSGNFTVTAFDAKSHDGELHVDYMMKLEPDIMDSMVTGCLRFKPSETLEKRDRKTFDAINLSGAERRADGLFHITLTDRLRDMKRLNQECGPNLQHTATGPEVTHPIVRPNITVMPEPQAGSATPTPPPTPPLGPPPGIVAPPPAGETKPPGPEGEVPPVGSAAPGTGSGNEGIGAPQPAPAGPRPGEPMQRQ
jgi:type II secretion system protein N